MHVQRPSTALGEKSLLSPNPMTAVGGSFLLEKPSSLGWEERNLVLPRREGDAEACPRYRSTAGTVKREGKAAGGDTGDPVRTLELQERRHCSPVEDVSGLPALTVSPSDQPRAFSEPKLFTTISVSEIQSQMWTLTAPGVRTPCRYPCR